MCVPCAKSGDRIIAHLDLHNIVLSPCGNMDCDYIYHLVYLFRDIYHTRLHSPDIPFMQKVLHLEQDSITKQV